MTILVICAARDDELEPSLVLAVGVRRSPDLVQSDESTRKLIRAFVREVINAPADGPEHRCALVVAGAQEHAEQLALLADFAYKQMDAPRFFRLVRTPGKFDADIRGRLQAGRRARQARTHRSRRRAILARNWSRNAPGNCCPGSPC